MTYMCPNQFLCQFPGERDGIRRIKILRVDIRCLTSYTIIFVTIVELVLDVDLLPGIVDVYDVAEFLADATAKPLGDLAGVF